MTATHPSRVDVGTVWHRLGGREHVRIGRVWLWPDQGWTVRAHPVRGGKVLIAGLDWFVQHYAKDEGWAS